MKKLLWVIVISCCILSLAAQNTKVPFATGEWEPFTSEKLPNYGAVTELVSAICKTAGITPVYSFYPWARCEKTVETGEAFAAFPYAVTAERKALFNYSDPLFHSSNKVYYYTKNPKPLKDVKFEKISDLKGYTIGLIAGSFIADELDKHGVKYETTTTLDLSIKKLQMGRVDFVIDEQAVTYDTIKKNVS
ncbi:MAG TPA: transporter substrate-binding domain-containing protein [Candidatus Cloacimonadota bacterium]|nr:transporter substrate-binding domain-containing protein [Candidatus Cloacimonadota bacterium]HOD55117.1 transporter substrate-binding domain-containing protein [Candidatus Cloacimonadota bacterium]HPM01161.1 transporter substrate-binding domain-containing protein [Candidatus Cloacimonadota bacterium]